MCVGGRYEGHSLFTCAAFLALANSAFALTVPKPKSYAGEIWTGVYPGEERVAAVREILSIPDGYVERSSKA
ncbi:MAG: hypothetical protein J6Q84_05280 [Kiritimatiellae bacterium]|nr:hypothetical protein [Kiritimatiellia bacterium]